MNKTGRMELKNEDRSEVGFTNRAGYTYESCKTIRHRLTDLLGPPLNRVVDQTETTAGQYSLDSLHVFDKITYDGCRNKIVLQGFENDEYYVPTGESVSFSIETNVGRQVKKCWWIPTVGIQQLPTVSVDSGVGDKFELTVLGDCNIEEYPIKVLLELGEELPETKKTD